METPEALAGAPVDAQLVQAWLDRVPTLSVDGSRPTVEQLADRLGRFWIPRQRIVYIGVASKRLDQRLRAYYGTTLGQRSPHAGGHWIRTLAHLDSFHVWWSLAADPAAAEDALLTAFAGSVPAKSRARIPGGNVIVLPFANKENVAKTLRKPHGIAASTLPRSPVRTRPSSAPSSTPRSTEERSHRRGRASLADINAALEEIACADPDGRVTAVARRRNSRAAVSCRTAGRDVASRSASSYVRRNRSRSPGIERALVDLVLEAAQVVETWSKAPRSHNARVHLL